MITKKRLQEILSKFSSLGPVMVVGDVGIDKYTSGDVKRISPEAPVPVLEVSKEWNKLGLAANVSDNLSSFKVPSTLCGVVGEDTRANLFESLLEEKQLKTWGIIRDEKRMTTFKERITTSTQQICRVDYETKEGLSDEMSRRLSQRLKDFLPTHSGVILEDYGKGLFSESLCQDTIHYFKENKKLIAVDPSRSTPPLWYKGASLLKPNRTEAQLMVEALGHFKERRVEKMAEILMDKLNLDQLIITLGPDGMCICDRNIHAKPHFIPTAANEVFDVSGAGDTAIAAITASLLVGATLEEAAWVGNCASGVVIKKRGTALCSLDELQEQHSWIEGHLK